MNIRAEPVGSSSPDQYRRSSIPIIYIYQTPLVHDSPASIEYLVPQTTTIILDTLPAEMYSTVKLEAIRDPDLSLDSTDDENDLHQSFGKVVSDKK